jgi:hypothetical protein
MDLKLIPVLSSMPAIPPAEAAAHPAVVASKKTDRKFKKATLKSVAFFHVYLFALKIQEYGIANHRLWKKR